ncbi:MAG: hypothetical protein ACI8TP_000498 [Acidimicrobiales bacterium]|jgi:hypothetical protein
MADQPTSRVELVAAGSSTRLDGGVLGLALLLGLFLGRNSLLAAATGREQYELAIAHFVIVVLACVVGASVLTRVVRSLMPSAKPQPADEVSPTDQPADAQDYGIPLPIGDDE